MMPFENFADFSIPFLFGYAEIHYHLRYLYPRYFLKEPEIIADLPIRCIKEYSAKLPVLIIVKDAHFFPILLGKISVEIQSSNKLNKYNYLINKKLSMKYFSQILEIGLNDLEPEQRLTISVRIHYTINGKEKVCINDNYPNLKKQPFECYYAEKSLPFPTNWFPGEPHYHSIHTSDQVEFGADISSTKTMAKAMGLKWFFVTDHSYDLDDCEDDYTKNDLDLPIWKEMKENCRLNNEQDFRVIPGEEISIGNSEGKNIHLLAVNHPDFIEGHGDSAEKWFRNKPQHLLSEIKKKHDKDNLFVAAHPFEKVPFMQKLTLRRGSWRIEDYEKSGINFLQVINSASPEDVEYSVSVWSKLLMQGKRYYLLAGNDAHGNFNVMRQIKNPFWKLFSSQKQTFGKFFTAFYNDSNDPIKGIKSGKIIVSNGPFLNFRLKIGKEEFPIGSKIKSGKAELQFETASSSEFGEIENIVVHLGNIQNFTETLIENLSDNLLLNLPKIGYVRMSMRTAKGGLSFTNPIWIDQL